MRISHVFLTVFLSLGITACNNTPEVRKLKPGESAILKPIAPLQLTEKPEAHKNVFVHFSMGSKALHYSDKTTIEIYYKGDKETPKHSFKAHQLKTMYEDTNCPDGARELLVNAYEGDAIFCGGLLELDKIDFFKAVREGKSNKQATSFAIEAVYKEYDLIQIGVGFY